MVAGWPHELAGILPFSIFPADRYRPRTAAAYSSTLPLVMYASLGNTIYEATTLLSVT